MGIRYNISIFAATLLLPLMLASCSPSGTNPARFVRRTTSAANDHIMLVRATPPTFGFQRLAAFSSLYPDLAIFLDQQGYPEFLAETNKGENRYFILYYLETRKAFACRSGGGKSRQVEFSGPYPITDKEAKTLRDLRNKAENPAAR